MDLKFDIKGKIDEVVDKLRSDPKLLEKFTADPIKTLEGLTGIDLPDDAIADLAKGVQAKLNLDKLGGALGGLKGLFGK